MTVWVLMWDSLRGGAGVVSVHASVASAFGAALKVMDSEDDGNWAIDPFMINKGGKKPMYWTSEAMNSVYVQSYEVIP